jgi:hypothetical protein
MYIYIYVVVVNYLSITSWFIHVYLYFGCLILPYVAGFSTSRLMVNTRNRPGGWPSKPRFETTPPNTLMAIGYA